MDSSYSITLYRPPQNLSAIDEFNEALRHSALRYSMRDIAIAYGASLNDLHEALHKCLEVCCMAGISSIEHFEPIYVVDPNSGTTYPDWLMSKKGFSLMVMYLPLNQNTARWLLELADV
jgi:hypothetical protein